MEYVFFALILIVVIYFLYRQMDGAVADEAPISDGIVCTDPFRRSQKVIQVCIIEKNVGDKKTIRIKTIDRGRNGHSRDDLLLDFTRDQVDKLISDLQEAIKKI